MASLVDWWRQTMSKARNSRSAGVKEGQRQRRNERNKVGGRSAPDNESSAGGENRRERRLSPSDARHRSVKDDSGGNGCRRAVVSSAGGRWRGFISGGGACGAASPGGRRSVRLPRYAERRPRVADVAGGQEQESCRRRSPAGRWSVSYCGAGRCSDRRPDRSGIGTVRSRRCGGDERGGVGVYRRYRSGRRHT